MLKNATSLQFCCNDDTEIRKNIRNGYTEAFIIFESNLDGLRDSMRKVKDIVCVLDDIINENVRPTRKSELWDFLSAFHLIENRYIEVESLYNLLPCLVESYKTVQILYDVLYTFLMMYICHLSDLFGSLTLQKGRVVLRKDGSRYVINKADSIGVLHDFNVMVSMAQQRYGAVKSGYDLTLFKDTLQMRLTFWGKYDSSVLFSSDYVNSFDTFLHTSMDFKRILYVFRKSASEKQTKNKERMQEQERKIWGDGTLLHESLITVPSEVSSEFNGTLRDANSVSGVKQVKSPLVSVSMDKGKPIGFIYILTNPAFPQYVKIGYADDVNKRVSDLNRSSAVPFAFSVYATYEVNARLQDKQVHKIIDTLNPNLRVMDTTNGGKRVREFYEITPEVAYSLLKSIANLNGSVDKLHKWVHSNDVLNVMDIEDIWEE